MKNLLILLILLINFVAFSQNFKKVVLDESVKDEYYLVVESESTNPIGVLVLLPGFGQNPESIFPQSKLHNVAFANNLIVVAVGGGNKIYADEKVISKLDKVFNHIQNKYKVQKEKFIIGGFSAGGTISLGYVEYCYKQKVAPILPRAVFTVDSPVDLFELWNYLQREIKKNFSDAGTNEARFVSQIIQEEIGRPKTNAKVYEMLTPFHSFSQEVGNEKYLVNVAVRVYHDIDVSWQINNRRRSLFDSNALAASELINRLLILGNEKAEFMMAQEPGYRSEGVRHPHSWSIVDEIELINWAKKILKE